MILLERSEDTNAADCSYENDPLSFQNEGREKDYTPTPAMCRHR